MKRILITLMMIAAFCSLSLAQKKSTIYKDSAENVKITIRSLLLNVGLLPNIHARLPLARQGL